MDWELGRYERVAMGLLPAARAVVDHAAPRSGERAVDVGCGTGNGALLLAERGAQVIGVDPAERLLEIARAEARARGLDVAFVTGAAGALPCPDQAADLVISVFGVIFAPDATAAVRELARVLAPGGRIVISAWIPAGPISEMVAMARQATAAASAASVVAQPSAAADAPAAGQPRSGPEQFAWHERDALARLFGAHGLSVELEEHRHAFRASSPADWLDAELRDHPLWCAARQALGPRGELESVCARALEILTAGNERPDGFRVTSRYVIATATATGS